MPKRFLVHMAYDGSGYHGWQRQVNEISIQETVENAFYKILRSDISIVGCGRTDTGVHANQYFFHVDLEEYSEKLLYQLNSVLPEDIVLYDIQRVNSDFHARFDATKRAYVYYAHCEKNPFVRDYSSKIPELRGATLEVLNQVPKLLLSYDSFFPFCKAHGDNKTNLCKISRCEWRYDVKNRQYEFHVESDRFLRGMIRLMVGACVMIHTGKINVEQIKYAMDSQTRLPKSLSAPPQGLFLNKVEYDL